MTDQDRYKELGQVLLEGMVDSWRFRIRMSRVLQGSPQLPEEEETQLAKELLKNHLNKEQAS
jgi:hypothetical protein